MGVHPEWLGNSRIIEPFVRSSKLIQLDRFDHFGGQKADRIQTEVTAIKRIRWQDRQELRSCGLPE